MKFKKLPRAITGIKLHHPPSTRLLVVLLSGLLFFRCDGDRVYDENVDFEEKVWVADSVPVFRFQITDPEQTYNVYWNVRNSVAYPFRNLYVNYYLEDTLGHSLKEDLYNMDLFESRTGEPYGDGLGDIFTHQILALPGYKFDTAGMYQIRLQQYMRRDSLPEILSVGVRVETADTD